MNQSNLYNLKKNPQYLNCGLKCDQSRRFVVCNYNQLWNERILIALISWFINTAMTSFVHSSNLQKVELYSYNVTFDP